MARGHAIVLLTAIGGAIGAMAISQRRRVETAPEPSPEPQPMPMPLDPRSRVIAAAEAEIGVQNPSKYWAEVLPSNPGFSGAWCGGFALWALHQAGIGAGIPWEIGRGFCYRLPTTTDPQPGDIGYIDQPYQHHAIVVRVDRAGVHTIDGNQSGESVARRVRPASAFSAFYSISPLLAEAGYGAV